MQPDLDQMAAQLADAPSLAPETRTELVVTLAEHRDRRVIEPLIDLLTSNRGNELTVRAAGWFADPALHPALMALHNSRLGDLGSERYWIQVDRALERCDPAAPEQADQVEVTILTTTQASLLTAGALEIEVSLDGAYPLTELVLRLDQHERRHSIWNFDETDPDSPQSLDLPFTLFRVGTLAQLG